MLTVPPVGLFQIDLDVFQGAVVSCIADITADGEPVMPQLGFFRATHQNQ